MFAEDQAQGELDWATVRAYAEPLGLGLVLGVVLALLGVGTYLTLGGHL